MGHVFIVPGDVRRLACDGWLLPTDKDFVLSRIWKDDQSVVDIARNVRAERGRMGDGERGVRVDRVDGPDVWLVDVGLWENDMGWVHEGVCQFLHRAGSELGPGSSRLGRARPLVAMPVV